jgi:hypothetical protein
MSRIRVLVVLLAVGLLAVPAAAGAKPAKKATTVKVSRGATTLTLDPGTGQALTSLGLTVSPLNPAKAGAAGIAFPVTHGKLNAKTYAGTISHAGGLRFSGAAGDLDLRNFRIMVDAAPDLTADVYGVRLSIADLDLSKAKIAVRGRTVSITGVGVTLTEAAADALNSFYGTHALAGGLTLGTASVKTRIKK